jgi:mannosyltransferase OCH1-like enzyme
MTQEEKIDDFEENILPNIKEDILKIINYFEQHELPSAYSSCLQMYLANFMGFRAKLWDEHCSEYGVEIDFEAIEDSLKKVKTLDEFVSEYS